MPEKVPVVMEEIISKRLLGRGALPQVVVEPGGRVGRPAVSDGRAIVVIPSLGQSDVAYFAVVHSFHRVAVQRTAATLSADLNDARRAASGSNHSLAFVRRLAARFLDVHVLSGRAG